MIVSVFAGQGGLSYTSDRCDTRGLVGQAVPAARVAGHLRVGEHPAGPSDYAACRESFDRLAQALRGAVHP